MAEKLVLTTTTWSVQLPKDSTGYTPSADFDTVENARAAWADNQPSLLIATTEHTFMRDEVLEKWEARK